MNMPTFELNGVQRRPERRHQRGQVIVLFGLGLVVMIAMVGFAIDVGAAYAQSRSEQNAADLAALAGANDYLLNNNSASAVARAQTVAAQNGYPNGGSVNVDVSIDTSNGAKVTVNVGAPHHNYFASIVGMTTWNVSTAATALTGFPDTASGAAPFLFSILAFDNNGKPLSQYGDPNHPYAFGDGNGDVPNNAGDIAWTNYGTGNVDTAQVRAIINGSLVINKTLAFGDYIGQHNNGFHNALFSDVNSYLDGENLPVPVVDANGNFQGWATFHVVSADGGSAKTLTGYFKSDFQSILLTIGGCSAGQCPRYLGSYVLKLSN
jgi:Flp pilus assembly protein TadG